MKVLYYIEKRLSDRYSDNNRHWFVDWMITEDDYSMSKYTFKCFAIVDGIPFDEYTNDKAKWHKKKAKECYPSVPNFITYPDNVDEMRKIYEETDWRKKESLEKLFDMGLLVKQLQLNTVNCLTVQPNVNDKNKYRIIKEYSRYSSTLDRADYPIRHYKVFDTYEEALTACNMREAEDEETRKEHLKYDFYDAVDWYVSHYPELEKIRGAMETLPYGAGFQFLYSKQSGELFYKSCFNEERHLIYRIGEITNENL